MECRIMGKSHFLLINISVFSTKGKKLAECAVPLTLPLQTLHISSSQAEGAGTELVWPGYGAGVGKGCGMGRLMSK
jgi:hypothetical protein